MAENKIPEAVKKYAESQGLPLNHPRILKYAASMVGRRADDEVIESPTKARSLWEEDEQAQHAGH